MYCAVSAHMATRGRERVVEVALLIDIRLEGHVYIINHSPEFHPQRYPIMLLGGERRSKYNPLPTTETRKSNLNLGLWSFPKWTRVETAYWPFSTCTWTCMERRVLHQMLIMIRSFFLSLHHFLLCLMRRCNIIWDGTLYTGGHDRWWCLLHAPLDILTVWKYAWNYSDCSSICIAI